MLTAFLAGCNIKTFVVVWNHFPFVVVDLRIFLLIRDRLLAVFVDLNRFPDRRLVSGIKIWRMNERKTSFFWIVFDDMVFVVLR